MRTVTVKPNQTLADIAVQEYGSLSALFLLAEANGIAPAARLQPGRVLRLPEAAPDREMQEWCKGNRVSPATAEEAGGIRLRVFTAPFTGEFC